MVAVLLVLVVVEVVVVMVVVVLVVLVLVVVILIQILIVFSQLHITLGLINPKFSGNYIDMFKFHYKLKSNPNSNPIPDYQAQN